LGTASLFDTLQPVDKSTTTTIPTMFNRVKSSHYRYNHSNNNTTHIISQLVKLLFITLALLTIITPQQHIFVNSSELSITITPTDLPPHDNDTIDASSWMASTPITFTFTPIDALLPQFTTFLIQYQDIQPPLYYYWLSFDPLDTFSPQYYDYSTHDSLHTQEQYRNQTAYCYESLLSKQQRHKKQLQRQQQQRQTTIQNNPTTTLPIANNGTLNNHSDDEYVMNDDMSPNSNGLLHFDGVVLAELTLLPQDPTTQTHGPQLVFKSNYQIGQDVHVECRGRVSRWDTLQNRAHRLNQENRMRHPQYQSQQLVGLKTSIYHVQIGFLTQIDGKGTFHAVE
jgi:hypothetical protein